MTVIDAFTSEHLRPNLRRKTHAEKPLEIESYETCFHNAKTGLHMSHYTSFILDCKNRGG